MNDDSFRHVPAGSEIVPGGTAFRVWAPEHDEVEVLLRGPSERAYPLEKQDSGYFYGVVAEAKSGSRYKYRLDGRDSHPDVASRFQPDGPHEPSEVIDPSTFEWTDQSWRGLAREGQVIYEMHVGTFTPEGSWKAAESKLEFLRDTGITAIEVMPVGEFPGDFGWGYDGVHPFAPTHLYGRPDDFRHFVDRAHSIGIGVILDVVYNHFGPDGNYFGQYSKWYFTEKYETDWGAAINYDAENSGPVRDLIIANACYWIREFHLDGLRLDATQNIYDDSADHILAALTREARKAAGAKTIIVAGENEPQETKLVRDYGLDMLWNDDYHHAALVAMTGHNEAYYADYKGSPQEFISAMKYGYLFQGQWYQWQQKRRGTPCFGLLPASFVTFTQNHDQIANSARGLRSRELTDPGTFRALTALTLLGPGTPMLFQGQEFGATSPFYYFADHKPDLRRQVRDGRIEFMSQFVSMRTPEMNGSLPDPGERSTFERSKLNWDEVQQNQAIHRLHSDLLRLRHEDPVLHQQRPGAVDGAVLSAQAFVLRYFGDDGDRLLIVNLGMDLNLDPAPEPLLAPLEDHGWRIAWSSENPSYGGCGTAPVETEQNWWIPGRSAILLTPTRRSEQLPKGRPLEKDKDE